MTLSQTAKDGLEPLKTFQKSNSGSSWKGFFLSQKISKMFNLTMSIKWSQCILQFNNWSHPKNEVKNRGQKMPKTLILVTWDLEFISQWSRINFEKPILYSKFQFHNIRIICYQMSPATSQSRGKIVLKLSFFSNLAEKKFNIGHVEKVAITFKFLYDTFVVFWKFQIDFSTFQKTRGLTLQKIT